jgi:hypothetical protein
MVQTPVVSNCVDWRIVPGVRIQHRHRRDVRHHRLCQAHQMNDSQLTAAPRAEPFISAQKAYSFSVNFLLKRLVD